MRAQNDVILALYNRIDGAQRGHIRAVTSLLNRHKRQAAREAKETVLRMEAEGRPREEIVRVTGKTLNHVRQIVFQAKRDGYLPGAPPAQGRLDLEGGAQ